MNVTSNDKSSNSTDNNSKEKSESLFVQFNTIIYKKTDASIINSVLKLFFSFESLLQQIPIQSIKSISRIVTPLTVPFRDATYVLNAAGTCKKAASIFCPNDNSAITIANNGLSVCHDVLKNIEVARKINFISERVFHTSVKLIGFGKVIQFPSLAFAVGAILGPFQYISTAVNILDIFWLIYRDIRPKENIAIETVTKTIIKKDGKIIDQKSSNSMKDSSPKITLTKVIRLTAALLFITSLVIGGLCIAGQAALIATVALQFFSSLLNCVNHYIDPEILLYKMEPNKI